MLARCLLFCLNGLISLAVQRSAFLLATVVVMCCMPMSLATDKRRMRSKGVFSRGTSTITVELASRKGREVDDKTAVGRRLLQQRQNIRSQDIAQAEHSRALMNPEVTLFEVDAKDPMGFGGEWHSLQPDILCFILLLSFAISNLADW